MSMTVDASELYGDDPGVIIAGLLDGADHASCSSCRKVMRSARLLIERLLLKEASHDADR